MHKNRTLFTFLTALSIYWTVNLILWFPWSISTTLGITLMLTAAPFIWAYGIFKCLRKYPSGKMLKVAALISSIYLLVAVISDYFFFGILRNAMTELYQPTTFYGYAFLVALPFALIFCFSKSLKVKEDITNRELFSFLILGFLSISLLICIIKFNITI